MRTLQLIGGTAYGGGTNVLLRWCRYLIAKGCQVDVLSTDTRTVQELRKIEGIRIIDDIHIPREIEPIPDLRAFFRLLSLMRNESYDVVHTYTSTPGFLGRLTGRLGGIPVVLHRAGGWAVHDLTSPPKRILYTPLSYLAGLASTKTICVSHANAQKAREMHLAPQSKLVTICSGIDPQPFLQATSNGAGEKIRQELSIPADCLLIGNAGRLTPLKDNETTIRAMAHLKSLTGDHPFSLLLAGNGRDRQKLEDLIHSLGLGDRVRLLGFRRDIPAFLAGLDIFVSPSLAEGLSISLLEAMAAARPIVTSSILPNAELIKHEVTGLLVPTRSPEHLARAIARFVREPELARQCASAARQRVLESYSLERMLLETWNLYVDLLTQRRPQSISA